MSGHSHWKKIKHAKGATDAQRGKDFSKIARLITIAARGGGNPDENSKLREAIEEARAINMPSVNVERAIKRGTGEIAGGELQEVLFEAYGPGNSAIIIEGITDNKNRAIAEIKHILNANNGKLVGEGAVRWLFERKGTIVVSRDSITESGKPKEEIELKVIDAGADNFIWRGQDLEIHTKIENFEAVKQHLTDYGFKVESAILGWVPKEEIDVSEKEKQTAEKLFEALDENEAVQEIYSNLRV